MAESQGELALSWTLPLLAYVKTFFYKMFFLSFRYRDSVSHGGLNAGPIREQTHRRRKEGPN